MRCNFHTSSSRHKHSATLPRVLLVLAQVLTLCMQCTALSLLNFCRQLNRAKSAAHLVCAALPRCHQSSAAARVQGSPEYEQRLQQGVWTPVESSSQMWPLSRCTFAALAWLMCSWIRLCAMHIQLVRTHLAASHAAHPASQQHLPQRSTDSWHVQRLCPLLLCPKAV